MDKKINYNKGRFNILTSFTDGYDYSDFEDDLDNIKEHTPYNVPVIMTGTIGRWDGDFDIAPVVCKSVFSAIDMCREKYILDIEVFFDDGKIEVVAHHHDSTNYFTIRALSKKGRTRWTMADYGYDKVSMRGMTADDIKKDDTKRFKYLYA